MKYLIIIVSNLISLSIGCVVIYFYYQSSMADSSEDVITREIRLLSKAEKIEIPCSELENTNGWVVVQKNGISVFWLKAKDRKTVFKLVVDSDFSVVSEDVQDSCKILSQ